MDVLSEINRRSDHRRSFRWPPTLCLDRLKIQLQAENCRLRFFGGFLSLSHSPVKIRFQLMLTRSTLMCIKYQHIRISKNDIRTEYDSFRICLNRFRPFLSDRKSKDVIIVLLRIFRLESENIKKKKRIFNFNSKLCGIPCRTPKHCHRNRFLFANEWSNEHVACRRHNVANRTIHTQFKCRLSEAWNVSLFDHFLFHKISVLDTISHQFDIEQRQCSTRSSRSCLCVKEAGKRRRRRKKANITHLHSD